MIGADAATESVTDDVADPALFIAVMVYDVEVKTSVGVPVITHVELLIDAHAGKAGLALQLVIEAPLSFNVVGKTDIATPTLPLVPVAPVKFMIGAEATTESVTDDVVDPALFVAVIVYDVEDRIAVGIPLITHVELLIDAQDGSNGLITHEP